MLLQRPLESVSMYESLRHLTDLGAKPAQDSFETKQRLHVNGQYFYLGISCFRHTLQLALFEMILKDQKPK